MSVSAAAPFTTSIFFSIFFILFSHFPLSTLCHVIPSLPISAAVRLVDDRHPIFSSSSSSSSSSFPSSPSSSTTNHYSHLKHHSSSSSSYHRRFLFWPSPDFLSNARDPLPRQATSTPSQSPSPSPWQCHSSHLLHGGQWWGMGVLALVIILLMGLLAGLTLGVMSMDTLRLKVWTRTGSEERRAQAHTILSIRRHPNWLLTSLILTSVALNEGLPLILNRLFPIGAWKPFVFSTILVTLVGELLPQAIMPLFIFQIVNKSSWFIYAVMWLSAPLSVPIAWVFRWCISRKKGPSKIDGLLEVEELGEFVRAHEEKQGWGGELDGRVGEVMRRVLDARDLLVGGADNWSAVPKVDDRMFINAPLAGMLARSSTPFAIVMSLPADAPMSGFQESGTMSGTVSGILLKKEILSVDLTLKRVRDLNVLSIPVVHETCKLFSLAEWFMESQAHVALTVPSTDDLRTCNDIAWSTGGRGSNSPRGPSVAHELSPLGVISAGDFYQRMFSCVFKSPLVCRSESPDLLVPQSRLWKGLRRRARQGKVVSRSVTYDGILDLAHTTGSRTKPNISAPLQKPRSRSASILSIPKAPWTISCGGLSNQSRKQMPWQPEDLLMRSIRRHENLTDPAEDAMVVAIIARATKDLKNQGIRRHELLTDPAEDEVVAEIIRKATVGLTV